MRKAEAHPALVKEILARGHSVGLHSYAHDRLFALRSEERVREDLERGMEVLEAITGEPPCSSARRSATRTRSSRASSRTSRSSRWGWNVSARDGTAGANVDRVVARVCAGLRDGAIVLMHDASERGTHAPVAAEAIARIVAAAREARMDVVPLLVVQFFASGISMTMRRPARSLVERDGPPRRLDDPPAHRETEPRPFAHVLRRHERLEDTLAHRRRHAGPVSSTSMRTKPSRPQRGR